MTFPESLVEVRYGAYETFLLRRIRGGYNIPADGCIAEELGLLRHHILFGALVVLIVDCKSRGVPLGKYRVHSQKKSIWEVSRVGGRRGEQRGMVWPCELWNGMVGEVAV